MNTVFVNKDGIQIVNADKLTCSCGTNCRRHGIIAFEDRDAAYQAGRRDGVAAGRLQNVAEEVRALTTADELLCWVRDHTNVAAKDGPGAADWFAGPRPGDRS